MKVIDSHAHLCRHPEGLDRLAGSGKYGQIWLMDLSPLGHLCGFELASEAELLDVVRDFDGFFLAFGFLDLDRAVPDDLDRLREKGFCGVKPYKPLKPYDDPVYFPLYFRAAKLGLPILFHTGLIAKGASYDGRDVNHSYGSSHARPSCLAGIAEAFPDLFILNGHLGWPWIEEMEQNLYYYRNITCDTSGYRRSPERLTSIFDRRCADGSDDLFLNKIRFASDMFLGCEEENRKAQDILQFWKLYFELIGSVYYHWGSREGEEAFFYGKALRLRDHFLKKQANLK